MNKLAVCLVAIIAFFAIAAVADIYMFNPRGSNNRFNGDQRDRQNANRLFDSQNNARGGFNAGNLVYYEGSILPIEWAAQHGCGNAINQCEFIVQYTCDAKLRDGTTETTIKEGQDDNYTYGRHESNDYYQSCKQHSRNKGLFTSNQKMNAGATSTRQNSGATRYGFECAEERDYYPYWRASPWIDIAVFTSTPQRCEAYLAESENVKGRYNCVFNNYLSTNLNNPDGSIPVTQESCETTLDIDGVAGVWTYSEPKNLPPPECIQTLYTRENHIGNTIGGYPLTYNWTIPTLPAENCALRIRYNITTADFPGFAASDSVQAGWDASNNAGYFPEDMYNLTEAEQETRQYYIKNNPEIDIFGSILPNLPGTDTRLTHQLNLNTNQYFRTFEDRSHRFSIRSREGKFSSSAVIHNINVGGKRGNIVQTFPAHEYNFQPSKVDITLGDIVHFQWTGSNSNPNNNDGQGRAGSDRSNVCLTRNYTYNPTQIIPTSASLSTFGAQPQNHPSVISDNPLQNFLGWDRETLLQLALLSSVQNGGDMEELDDAGTYFNMEPQQVSRLGIFNYLCTRNNNFSNRSQKGQITVSVSRSATAVVGWNGGTVKAIKGSTSSVLQTNHAELSVPQAAFSSAVQMSVSISPAYILEDYNVDRKNIASDVVFVSAGAAAGVPLPGEAELSIDNTASPISNIYIARAEGLQHDSSAPGGSWTKLKTRTSGSVAYATITQPGAYVVKSELNAGIIVGIVIGCVAVLALAIFLIIFCKKRADKNAMKLAGVDV